MTDTVLLTDKRHSTNSMGNGATCTFLHYDHRQRLIFQSPFTIFETLFGLFTGEVDIWTVYGKLDYGGTLKGFFRGIGNGFKFTGEFIEGILWQVGDRLTLVNHKRNLHLDHQEDQCS